MSSGLHRLFVALSFLCLPAFNAQANSVGFSATTYVPVNGQLIVTVVYDYTNFSMIGGRFDLLYDIDSLEYVSFTAAQPLEDVAYFDGGLLGEWGRVTRLGFSALDVEVSGINSSGNYGTFVFNVLSNSSVDSRCNGFQLCLIRNEFSPLVALTGEDVTDELLENAYASAAVPLPLPIWLLGSALFVLMLNGGREKPD